jgi:hypothetical protein
VPDTREHPIQGNVKFIQHNLPGLDAGEYQLTVSQKVSEEEEPYRNQYHFAIQAPRFTLNPNELYAVYPPDQTQGEYTDTLPQVVLTTQTLPWMRRPTIAEPDVQFPDKLHDRDIPTWLAVLSFDAEDEAAFKDSGFSAQAKSGQVRDLFFKRPTDKQPQGYSYFYTVDNLDCSSDVSELDQHLEYGQSANDACNYIDIPLRLFWEIAPSIDDLKMMAHVRNVEITRKATQNGIPASRSDLSKIPGTSNFALVTGNRLPQTGKRCIVHLVSLEAVEPFLPIDPATSDEGSELSTPNSVQPENAAKFDIDSNGFIRLVSLATWSFTSTGTGKRFEELLSQLAPKNTVSDGKNVSAAPEDFSLGLPVSPVQENDAAETKQVKNALLLGYTALTHHTRDAGNTVSWYRGPLLPYLVKTDTLPPFFSSADAATIYNPDTGIFDISYAAAWQIGQLLALQDKHFSVALYNWRRDNLRGVVAQMETLLMQQTLDNVQQQLQDEQLIYQLLKPFLPSISGNGNSDKFAVEHPAQLGANRAERAKLHRSVLTDAAAISAMNEPDLAVPIAIYTWLAKLKLLDGIPFNYLVPDERMLPAETIRFFYVDVNWLHALIDGAMSVGRSRQGSAADPTVAHDLAVKAVVNGQLTRQASISRTLALGLSVDGTKNNGNLEVVSGFILRSEVVQGWPGLEVNGYTPDGQLMDIVRFERLAPTVLLCLFELNGQLLGSVDIHEPAESLHFGVTDTQQKSVNIRYNFTDGDKNTAGEQVPDVLQPVPFRVTSDSDSRRLLRLYRLAKNLHAPQFENYIHAIYSGYDYLPSSEFALQMVKGVGLIKFDLSKGL